MKTQLASLESRTSSKLDKPREPLAAAAPFHREDDPSERPESLNKSFYNEDSEKKHRRTRELSGRKNGACQFAISGVSGTKTSFTEQRTRKETGQWPREAT